MQLNNWTIFDKAGSQLNWFADSYINLDFASDVSAAGATGYLITDPSLYAVDADILNSGFYYIPPTSVSYTYAFGAETPIDITTDVSVDYVDVSIFNPVPINTQGIGGLSNIDISTLFTYPSVVYTSAIFLEPVSQGIVETEHLYIFQEIDSEMYRPYDASNYSLIFEMDGDDNEIAFFTVNNEEETIDWTDVLYYDIDVLAKNVPLSINVGFRAEDEGVYERKLRIYNEVNGVKYLVAEIIVNAESIGEDERFRTLLGNFGLPDPKDFPKLFKEADINEDLPDYEIVNPKSKQMILEHAEIMPYIGTYKALINAIKWLGYEDIYVREWFKNVKSNKKLSLIVPYDAKDRAQTILKFSPAERKALKKLNQLSLNYCLTRETGETDEWGTPETENCYEYNINEVFVKLLSLKDWLEKNIIGVNARIIDVTGEGIYFERYINLIYATQNHGFDYDDSQTLTPYTIPDNSELILGEASINMTLLELTNSKIGELNFRFADFTDYVWNPADPSVTLSPNDPSYLADPSSYLEVGAPWAYPFIGIKDIQWRASQSKYGSSVIPETHMTKPLWIYNEELKFYNIFDTSTLFFDTSVNVDVRLEYAFIKDASNYDWEDATSYEVYPNNHIYMDASSTQLISKDASYAILEGSGWVEDKDGSISFNIGLDPCIFIVDGSAYVTADTSTVIQSEYYFNYIMESSVGAILEFDELVTLSPDTGSILEYGEVEHYGTALIGMTNFKTIDSSGNTFNFENDKLYYLEIKQGVITLDVNDPSDYLTPAYSIDYEYDGTNDIQHLALNIQYSSPRMPLYVVDPSVYYWTDPSGLSGGDSSLAVDNSIYSMTVNHIGNYEIESFAWDGYNILYTNHGDKTHEVWIKSPRLYSLIDTSDNISEINPQSEFLTQEDVSALIDSNKYPIFDRIFPFQGLTLEVDATGESYINVPNMTWFQDVNDFKALNKFYNCTEDVIYNIGNVLTVDVEWQSFYPGDDVTLVYFDKGSYNGLLEASTYVTGVSGNDITVDNFPFVVDASHDVFLQNHTRRNTQNAINDFDASTFMIDISGYTFIDNQLVAMIISDSCTGYEWGSSYRVISSDGSIHTFSRNLPQFIVADTSRYEIEAKHAYSTFARYTMDVSSATFNDSDLELYLDDYRKYFLDSTFVNMPTPFNQHEVIDDWYDPSDNLVNSKFYYYPESITVDTSELVLLKSEYDTSTYLLNQKNIWTVKENVTKDTLFRVHNESVPYIFDVNAADYNILVESYDYYGNLAKSGVVIHIVQ